MVIMMMMLWNIRIMISSSSNWRLASLTHSLMEKVGGGIGLESDDCHYDDNLRRSCFVGGEISTRLSNSADDNNNNNTNTTTDVAASIDNNHYPPSDPLYPKQWYHDIIKSNMAWNMTTGIKHYDSSSFIIIIMIGDGAVIVAVIDSGIDYTHPDLVDNIWINKDEIPGSSSSTNKVML